ncbi:MAG TPA: DUF2490 domain-containing protein [Pyrinomonadaceae bacterium]|nr:DUF2490 domain-containing protein [Pyrinomonadaceae bacterium]
MQTLIKCRPACLLLLLLTAGGISAQTPTAPQSDTQQWNELQISVPLSKQIEVVFLGTLRLGGDIQRPVDERVGIAFSFKLGKYVTVAPSYLNITTQPLPGQSFRETRLSIPATVRFQIGKFVVSNRNLIERRLRPPRPDSTRNRNKLQIDHPLIASKNLNWFVSDEVFYDWAVNDWVRNRFSAGVSKVLNKHLTVEIFYLRQNDGRALPGDLNVVGTSWRLRP